MDKLVFSREGKVGQVTTLTGEPAGHGLYEQASIGSSETLQYVGVPGAAVEARETDTLEDDGEGFSELCGVSTKRTPSEPEIQWPARLCRLVGPCQAAEPAPGAALWRPRMANSDLSWLCLPPGGHIYYGTLSELGRWFH